MNELVVALDRPRPAHLLGQQVSLGRSLVETGLIAPWQLFYAFDRQHSHGATLSEILLSKGWVSAPQMLRALSAHYTAQTVDLEREPPDRDLANLLPPDFCLKHNILPWQSVGGLLIVVTGRPERFETLLPVLPDHMQGAIMALCDEDAIASHLARSQRRPLTRMAETRVSERFSCRGWDKPNARFGLALAALCLLLIASLIWQPTLTISALTLWAVFSLIAVSITKVLAFAAQLLRPVNRNLKPPDKSLLPRISIMVPLFREKEIAHALIARLSRLTYPKALLDVLLVLEEHDDLTHDTIARTSLPHWMKVVTVPAGSGLTTKPRALNYALDHCRGDIIGIWDAEDAPAPDQLEIVAATFAQSPPDVVCLQGILDYYNPWTNWLSRCFTIEYATWFRCILPGLVRLGFAIPLGGTTLFLKRHAIEELGGWDAHNVTEDADLGVRIARFGYRTEMMPTVTQEEANCTPIAWVRQRSRWLKGYLVTYIVHMRTPIRLLRDIGPVAFLGMQLVFLCTLSQFFLAPLIWAFWSVSLGLPYPETPLVPASFMEPVGWVFMGIGAVNILISVAAIRGQGRMALLPYILTLPIYFSLACFAGYKALFEILLSPYYWDKTAHGKTEEGTSAHHSGVGVLFQPGHKGL